MSKSTLCWNCGVHFPECKTKCSWDDDFKPVDGWVADKTTIHNRYKNKDGEIINTSIESFCVHSCPLFITQESLGYGIKKEQALILKNQYKINKEYNKIGFFRFIEKRNREQLYYLGKKIASYYGVSYNYMKYDRKKYFDMYFSEAIDE